MDFKYIDSRHIEVDGSLYLRKYSFRKRKDKYTFFEAFSGEILFKDVSEITIEGAQIQDHFILEGILSNILFRRSCECESNPEDINDGIFDDTFDDTFE